MEIAFIIVFLIQSIDGGARVAMFLSMVRCRTPSSIVMVSLFFSSVGYRDYCGHVVLYFYVNSETTVIFIFPTEIRIDLRYTTSEWIAEIASFVNFVVNRIALDILPFLLGVPHCFNEKW